MESSIFVYSAVVGLVVIMGLLITILASHKKGKAIEVESKTFFIVGLVWFVLGLPLYNTGLLMLGIVFLFLSISNKAGWMIKKTAKKEDKLGKNIQNLVVIVSILSLLLGLVTFLSF